MADHDHHDHAFHDHGHGGHDHGHHHGDPIAAGRPWMRYGLAALLVVIAAAAACLVTVRSGTATVITRFGDPVRVITDPGLTARLPAPIERTTTVDLRLTSSSSGLATVQTKDSTTLVAQAYVVWRLPAEREAILRFLRSVGGDAATAENQMRSLMGSMLVTVTGRFAVSDLLGPASALDAYEKDLTTAIAAQAAQKYGLAVVQVGIERLGLPETTVAATVARMAAERDTVAAERRAAGERQAGEIEAEADKQARLIKAKAGEEAATTLAKGRAEAAAIARGAYAADPQLYEFLRSLDTLEQAITAGTRIILRTDAAPFRVLVEQPAVGNAPAGNGTPTERGATP